MIKTTIFLDYFYLYLKLFKCVGIRLNLDDEFKVKIWKRLNTFYMVLCFFTMTFMSVLSVLFISIGDKSVEKKLISLIILLTNIELLAKVFCIVKNSEKIEKFLKVLESFNKVGDSTTEYLMKETNIILVYSKVSILSMITFFFIPLSTTILILVRDNKWLAIYTNEVWYPFDDQNVQYYGPIYLIQSYFTFIFMCYYTAADGLILFIMIHINQQFHALSLRWLSMENLEQLSYLVDRHCQVSK